MAVDDSYTKLLLHMDGSDNGTTFTDEAGKSITRNNALTKTSVKKFGTAAGYFDGNGDNLRITDSADWAFGTGDFTVDFWVYLVAGGHGSAWSRLFETESWPTAGGINICTYASDNPTVLSVQLSNGTQIINSNSAVANTTWTHVALVRASGVMNLYINGVKQTATYSTSQNFTSQKLSIGARLDNGAEYFNGYLDEFRVSKGIARWTANFTPATGPYLAPYLSDGTATFGPFVLPAMIADPASTSIAWTASTPAGTTLVVKAAIVDGTPSEGDYLSATNGGGIPGISAESSEKNLFIKAYLETETPTVTPSLTALSYHITEATEMQKVLLTLPSAGRFKYPQGDVSIAYTRLAGGMEGPLGALVEDWAESFTPLGITAPVFNPAHYENVSLALSATTSYLLVSYLHYQGVENISASISASAILIHVDDLEQ